MKRAFTLVYWQGDRSKLRWNLTLHLLPFFRRFTDTPHKALHKALFG